MAKKNYFNKTKKAPHKYKSSDTYLRALYMANRELIDNKWHVKKSDDRSLNFPRTPYQMFKEEIYGDDVFRDESTGKLKFHKLSTQEIKTRAAELSTTQLYGREKQLKEEIRGMFKRDNKALRELRHQLGWKRKIDWSNVKYHGDPVDKDNRYFYIENEDGDRVGFKLGDYYRNKKRLTLVYLDDNYDVAYETQLGD